jgi:Zn-dependent peptidase ImmA (M78 family)
LLGLKLSEPEEIEPEILQASDMGTEVAGILDRELQLIVVARKFSIHIRRFTLAHELGHWFLHPGLTYHRALPMSGGERLDRRHPLVEREANLFAAELLMPRRQVSTLFAATYGPRVHPDEVDEKLAFRLSLGSS